MNQPPEVVTEPFTIMLYGITTESVSQWLTRAADAGELSGMAASPGVAEGVARVDQRRRRARRRCSRARSSSPASRRRAGARCSAASRAAVTDIGGMMSHAAIVCREYGLPAVTGTGSATRRSRPGQRVRVDGSSGTVTILD